MLFLPFQIMIP